MTREKYESLPLSTLKEVAKTRGLRGISTMKKAILCWKKMTKFQ